MPLVTLDIPAGVYRNGTDYQSSGRWYDADLVRWIDNAVKPVGGWLQKSQTATASKCRSMYAWADNSQARYIAAATHNKLYAYDENGAQYDITPAGLSAGIESATGATGFGTGNYGSETYGTARADSTFIIPATSWALDNWGEYLVACSSADGKIYEWQLDYLTPTPAAVIANAPTNCRGLLVTEERFLMALGAGGNPRKLQWSDREDNTTWTPLDTNEAGDIELQTDGAIQVGVRTRDQSLILTTTDAHTTTYIGPPFVFSIQRVGTGCGVISKKAVAAFSGGVVWMGRQNFFIYAGGQVSKLPSEVHDHVFADLNRDFGSHVFAVHNSRFSEVWFFYPSGGSTENDRYVSWNYDTNAWSIGTLVRIAGVDQGAYTNPIWVSPEDNHLYEHEIGLTHTGYTPFIESGPIGLGAGDNVMRVKTLIPDEENQGEVEATFKTRFHPNDTERTYGTYSMTNPTSVRFTGRQIRMRLESTGNLDWRVGRMRLEVSAGGRR